MNACAGKTYRTRDPEASPFFALVRDCFDEFEPQSGYWWDDSVESPNLAH